MENLIGKTFNYLTVIDGPIRKNNKIFWTCKCKCGSIKDIRSDGLKSGKTKSCGCFKKDILIKRNIKRQTLDLTNQRFGKLVALEPTLKRSVDGRVIWKCQCDCGNICFCDSHTLTQNKKMSCGCLISKGEYVIELLLKKYNISYVKQYSFQNCKFPDTKYYAKFDFYINNQYLIEYDGEQHYYYKNSPYTWNTKDNYEKIK